VRLLKPGRALIWLPDFECATGPRHQDILGGRLQLCSKMEAGDYVLRIIVTDSLAKDKYRVATQAMDFEVQK
jgi:hypothetical protein